MHPTGRGPTAASSPNQLSLGVKYNPLFNEERKSWRNYGKQGGSAGIGFWGFGSMLAITISWSVKHAILWMILHGILSWLYVIYYAIKR